MVDSGQKSAKRRSRRSNICDEGEREPERRRPTPDEPTATALWNHPVAAAALFGLASLGILSVVNVLVIGLGLPDWSLQAAVALLMVGLPIIVATAFSERQRFASADRTIRQWLTWRRSFQGGGLAFASLAAVIAGFMGLRATGIGPVGTLMAKCREGRGRDASQRGTGPDIFE